MKNFTLNTEIEINTDGNYFGKVSGDIFKFIEDPLTMYDADENKIAYAGDSYHFINQDSHGIYLGDEFQYDMVGEFEIFGEKYTIYDKDENLIAILSFNYENTEGKMYNNKGNLVAEYKSNYLYKDFDVIIYEECQIDTISLLMIFSSYYSDYAADSR